MRQRRQHQSEAEVEAQGEAIKEPRKATVINAIGGKHCDLVGQATECDAGTLH